MHIFADMAHLMTFLVKFNNIDHLEFFKDHFKYQHDWSSRSDPRVSLKCTVFGRKILGGPLQNHFSYVLYLSEAQKKYWFGQIYVGEEG